MPTYGPLSTAAKHPPTSELVRLQEQVEQIIQNCDHHFVPVKDLAPSKDPSVLDLGRADYPGAESQLSFKVICSKCATPSAVKTAECCPSCLIGKLERIKRPENAYWGTYFDESQNDDNFQLLRCPSCSMTGVYAYYDR